MSNSDSFDKTEGVRVFNLIILDESGSMSAIYHPALTGVNETLQTIRQAQEDHEEQRHFATLVTFDTRHYNEIYSRTPAEEAKDIAPDQYRPCGGTPLYDAMGRAINDLRQAVCHGDVVLVTVITDGYENASREYNGPAIKTLVEEMKTKGWVFTYIGANQDVEKVAESMAINNHMAFASTTEGTNAMFAQERRSRKRFFEKVNVCCKKAAISPEAFCDLSDGYFDDMTDAPESADKDPNSSTDFPF